jgi:hypothetical protein
LNYGRDDLRLFLIALRALLFGSIPFILIALALRVSVSVLGDVSLSWLSLLKRKKPT